MVPVQELLDYLDSSPSPWHAAGTAAEALLAGGFVELDETQPWAPLPAAGFTRRGGARRLAPADGKPGGPCASSGAHRLAGPAHPPPCRPGRRQLELLGVEVYGGVLLNSWLDRDLGIAGGSSPPTGRRRSSTSTNPSPAFRNWRSTSTARSTSAGSCSTVTSTPPPVGHGVIAGRRRLRRLARRARRGGAGVLGAVPVRRPAGRRARRRPVADRQRPPRQPGVVLGGDLRADGRRARAAHRRRRLFDHEEVGSESASGASGPLLADIVERVLAGSGIDTVDDVRRVIASSRCVSADNAHAVHPNYPERHDAGHAPLVNRGPAIKLNANQRYATDATTAALFRRAARRPACRCRRSSHATTSRAGRRSAR